MRSREAHACPKTVARWPTDLGDSSQAKTRQVFWREGVPKACWPCYSPLLAQWPSDSSRARCGLSGSRWRPIRPPFGGRCRQQRQRHAKLFAGGQDPERPQPPAGAICNCSRARPISSGRSHNEDSKSPNPPARPAYHRLATDPPPREGSSPPCSAHFPASFTRDL